MAAGVLYSAIRVGDPCRCCGLAGQALFEVASGVLSARQNVGNLVSRSVRRNANFTAGALTDFWLMRYDFTAKS